MVVHFRRLPPLFGRRAVRRLDQTERIGLCLSDPLHPIVRIDPLRLDRWNSGLRNLYSARRVMPTVSEVVTHFGVDKD